MNDDVLEFGEFRFVPKARELSRGGRPVELPRRSFECLDYLIRHRERAVHRDELVEAVFGRPNVSDAQLGQVVLRTRRVVGDDGNAQRMIRTVAGHGYRWVAPIERVHDADAEPATPAAHGGRAPAGVDVEMAPSNRVSAVGSEALAPPSPRISIARASRAHSRLAALALSAAALSALVAAVYIWRAPRVPDAPSPAVSTGADTPAPRAAKVAAPAVVLPLQVDSLREDGWVRLGAMDLVAERLRQSGLGVPPSETVLSLLHASGSTSDEGGAQAREVFGAAVLVRGRARREAGGWKVELAAQPQQGIAIPVTFSAPDPMQAARGAADVLLAALGRLAPDTDERDSALDDVLQRARAAMLANELDTARAILVASPQLAAAPEQLAYRLALVDFRAGRLDQVEAALDALLAGAAARADARFRADVLSARGTTRTRRGAFADGGRDFEAALAALGDDGDLLARGKARLGRANSLVAAHRYVDALADFGAARIELEGAGDVLGVARVDANLGMLELYRGRPAAALGYLPAAADRFQSFGALHELLLTLTGLLDAQLAMLQRAEAGATVDRATQLRERITDPDQRVDLLLNRAQWFIGEGRHREAADALVQARGIATSGNRVLAARQHSLDATLAAHEARWRDAASAARLALSDWPAAGADGDRAGTLLIQQRSLLALGRDAEAAASSERGRAPGTEPAIEPGRVADAIAMAEWAAHGGDAAASDAWFGFAAASAERRGVPAEIVAVAQAWAPRLLATGQTGQAVAMTGRVASWAARDFDAAVLQVRLYHALGQRDAWTHALRQARALAGERTISDDLATAPRAVQAPVR